MFYTRYAELCKRRDKSPTGTALELNISRATVNYWKNGKEPNVEAVKKIAAYFNVSADYLLELSDVETPETDIRAICEYTNLDETTLELLRMEREYNKDFLSSRNHIISFSGYIAEYLTAYENAITQRNLLNDRFIKLKTSLANEGNTKKKLLSTKEELTFLFEELLGSHIMLESKESNEKLSLLNTDLIMFKVQKEISLMFDERLLRKGKKIINIDELMSSISHLQNEIDFLLSQIELE